ncbi:hypothetical protein L289_1139 [Acinetobacter gerneri DSM 14967 = CIP 107464 = MTCC 9824]|nr:hypothetical protein L289_1139 [Acinetobacter gerneri DSM 14967 = CIP 107464 = MTCC 9824]
MNNINNLNTLSTVYKVLKMSKLDLSEESAIIFDHFSFYTVLCP